MEKITVEQLLNLLNGDKYNFDFLDFDKSSFVNKKMFAVIGHTFLEQILKEPDEQNWHSALDLKDIYDCGKCIMHIAQIYIKGIVPLESELVFGNESFISVDDAKVYVDRIFNMEKRNPTGDCTSSVVKYIDFSSMNEYEPYRIIDLRENSDSYYEKFSFEDIVANPYCVGTDFIENLVLVCESGCKSSIVAEILIKHGLKHVFVLKSDF